MSALPSLPVSSALSEPAEAIRERLRERVRRDTLSSVVREAREFGLTRHAILSLTGVGDVRMGTLALASVYLARSAAPIATPTAVAA